jgi:uncharacterized protein (TIGR00730 family)
MKNLLVFCGSASGNQPEIHAEVRKLGELMAAREVRLVFGGGNVGLMGLVADTVLANGGQATGVQPHFLDIREVSHKGLTELILVETMHQRKQLMHDMADAIVALPGGYGTLDEVFEMLTWRQLELHEMPIAVLNVNGFYDHILAQLDHMVAVGFLHPENRNKLQVATTADEVIALLGL